MRQDYNREITAGSVQTHHIGFVQAHRFGGSSAVKLVVVEQENNNDAEWNVLADGSAVFSSTQSVASADSPETFVPDQNQHFTGADAELQLDVTSSAGAADQLRVGVLVEST